MDPAISLILLRQGNRAIEDYVAEFCGLCDQVGFNDIAKIHFFVSKEISVLMPRNTPHWSLEKYIDFAHFAHTLLCLAGSPFTVGIIDGESCCPPVSTTPKCLYVMSGIIQVTPETVNVMSATPRPTHDVVYVEKRRGPRTDL